MLFVPLGTLDDSPIRFPGNLPNMREVYLVRHSVSSHVFVRQGTESDHVFLSENSQYEIDLFDYKRDALLVQCEDEEIRQGLLRIKNDINSIEEQV